MFLSATKKCPHTFIGVDVKRDHHYTSSKVYCRIFLKTCFQIKLLTFLSITYRLLQVFEHCTYKNYLKLNTLFNSIAKITL